MIENPGNFLLGPSETEVHKQTIQSIEYTIRTSMPGKISLHSLEQFGEEIVAAIEYLYISNELGGNTRKVIRSLEDAKGPLQSAIDAAHPGEIMGSATVKLLKFVESLKKH